MKVLVDAGNTSCKIAIKKTGQDFIWCSAEQILEQILDVTEMTYAQVAPQPELTQLINACNERQIPVQQAMVNSEAFGIRCGYPKTENLGIDRWLAILGAEQLYPETDLIIVDAGTAMTVDILTEFKRHLGGWIVPGLSLMQSSIADKAPGVFSSTQITQEHFGTNTPSALFEGCCNALTGCVEQAKAILQDIDFHAVNELKVILTGGDACILEERLKLETVVEKNLVFVGLDRI